MKAVAKLNASAKERHSQGLFVIEGLRLCRDALQSGVIIQELFYTQKAQANAPHDLDLLKKAAPDSYEITEQVAGKMSDTAHPQGVFCVCRLLDKPPHFDRIEKDTLFLALENMQDPSNFGGILRTAEALGITGVLLSPGCCDLYSPKVLRAAMGAVFRVNSMAVLDLPAFLCGLREKNVTTIAAVPDETAVPITELTLSGAAAVVIGNEGAGITPQTMDACMLRATIPMKGRAESLNAGVAAGIFLWELRRDGQ